ncbi:GIY-YIG nuclease family protein [Sphingomonas sp. CFBP 8760]|uniref:GIY-YIG nuclease family protein n=1 Tax=Sphingomonas sp. CFBP 8760 TaxID=2775282 RepID=UPI0017839FE7|nr:GIY-YIG nuclease family protein [Sphingomonas sp. CFBP 8760]MBD8547555.1 GIY-YIG nuclease family protein [Sphingomonas sp. CFBP 8760]
MRPAVYIMTNRRNGTLYVGVTSNLPQRAWQHREGLVEGFTKRYGCKSLVWFEAADMMEAAIMREKQIKSGSRAKKLALIEAINPGWHDLYEQIMHD